MVEADHIVTQTPAPNHAQRQSMSRAIRVLATQAAIKEVKAAIQRQGKIKLSTVPHRDIVSMAEARLLQDVAFRAECVAYAKRIREGWQWGPLGGLHTT